MLEPDRMYLMELFVKILHHGSFKAAAVEMGITPSKATKDIQRLERSIGSPLLNRTTRSVGVTRAGEIYYEGAVGILSDFDRLNENLNFARNRISGELRVTAPLLWGDIVLTPIILEFRQQHPDVSIIANYTDQFVDLYRDNYHVAFRSTVPETEPYLFKPICPDTTVICASRQYLDECAPVNKPRDLERNHFITYGSDANHRYSKLVFTHNGKTETVRVTGKLSFSSMRSVFSAVLQHQGIASVPKYLAQPELDTGNLIEILTEYKLQRIWFNALYTERRNESQLLAKFIDFVREHIP
ncbi:MAG: LysR family transcriptional regulator [Sneathiellales bacterium]|nr:LysR family transcriptional regulator [Sneathiellales bacterium]